MKNKEPSNTNVLVTEEDEIDLSRATYSTDLSSVSLDKESQSFHITIDKILYKHPVEVIETVLRVNGYALNLENILACLDDFKIGANIQLGSNFTNQTSAPKSFIHCVQFKLPQKMSAGPTLKKFYEEIESYESVIAELKGSTAGKIITTETLTEQKQKINVLEAENKSLKAEIERLRDQLDKAVKAEATASKAIANKNFLPPGIRYATVRDVDIDERNVILKSGPTTINLPLFMCDILPQADEKCLVHINQDNTVGSFFFDTQGEQIKPRLARVTRVDNNLCKIRDGNRNTWQIQAKNDIELELFRRLRRDDYIVLYLLHDKPLRFEELLRPGVSSHVDLVQEAISKFHIDSNDNRPKNS